MIFLEVDIIFILMIDLNIQLIPLLLSRAKTFCSFLQSLRPTSILLGLFA